MDQKINGKSIDEINIMLREAAEAEREEQEAYFDAQWEALKEEIALNEEQQMIRQYEDQEFGRLSLEEDYANQIFRY